MEENRAILMADLTGYTALTEIHGAHSAADIIDRYVAIVESCLVGNCNLMERTGDEVMIISDSADSLLATATLIMRATSTEENFLQVHGGLHYGNVLKRRNSYFGSAINLTARLTSKASPGTFWCSQNFIQSLAGKSELKSASKGKHHFKNISEAIEITELVQEHTEMFHIDPVCRMLILKKEAAIKHPAHDIYFCSAECLHQYKNPA